MGSQIIAGRALVYDNVMNYFSLLALEGELRGDWQMRSRLT